MFFWNQRRKSVDKEKIACDLVKQSDLFDAAWYLNKYPDVAQAQFEPAMHYLRHGANEGRNPGPWFDTNAYITAFGDSLDGKNPLLHYLEYRGNFILEVKDENQRNYSNFSDFLKFTATSPLILAPFKEEDRRCFAVMEAIGRHLIQKSKSEIRIKVSIIMPVWNRGRTLQSAIDSVLGQSYQNLELIIIDDGSDDDSCDVAVRAAARDSRIKFFKLNTHSGVCAARNFGLERATGDLIAYLDSDNTWLNDYVGATVGAFNLVPEAAAVFSGQYIYAEKDVSKLSAIRFGPMNVSLLAQRNYVDLNCFVHRRIVIDSGVRFNSRLQRLVDWDFILRISDQYRMCSVPVLLSQYYLHAADNTITKTIPIDSAIKGISYNRRKFELNFSKNFGFFKKLCIVIVSYGSISFLRDCIESLMPYANNAMVEVIIVDNCSADDVRNYLKELNFPYLKIIFNDINYGFSYAANQGVEAASIDADIVLLNNDAKLGAGSIEALQRVAYSASDIAISVPQQICPPQTPDMEKHVPYANPEMPCDVSLSNHHKNIDSIGLFHDGLQVELSFAPFFCVYIKRAAWDLCGGLDHSNGRHYRSDRIMCDYIRQILKQRIVYTPMAIVYHAVQAATKELERKSAGDDGEYRTMLINNVWPAELKRELGIEHRPWHAD